MKRIPFVTSNSSLWASFRWFLERYGYKIFFISIEEAMSCDFNESHLVILHVDEAAKFFDLIVAREEDWNQRLCWCLCDKDKDYLALYEAGADDCLSSSIEKEVFLAKLRNCLRKSNSASKTQLDIQAAERTITRMLVNPQDHNIIDLDIGVHYAPLEKIGGDFFNICVSTTGNPCVIVGDISGHGIQAAILQPMVRKLVQIHLRDAPNVMQGLCDVNEELRKELPMGIFTALGVAEWVWETNLIRFYRVGVPHPLLITQDGHVRTPMNSGTILGMHPTDRFRQLIEPLEIRLNPGDTMLVHTDGAIESEDDKGNDLGIEGLRSLIKNIHYKTAQGLVDECARLLQYHNTIRDDLTFIAIRSRSND